MLQLASQRIKCSLSLESSSRTRVHLWTRRSPCASLGSYKRFGWAGDGLIVGRQKVMVLYLANSALDSPVVGWAVYDGTGATRHMAGDSDTPPYVTGLDALKDGWRLFQASQLLPHPRGEEYDLAYLKYEFFFEQWIETT